MMYYIVILWRVTAGDTTLRNFGVRSLKTYSPGKEQALIEVLKKSSYATTGTLVFTLRARIESFGAGTDKVTGQQVQRLKDDPK